MHSLLKTIGEHKMVFGVGGIGLVLAIGFSVMRHLADRKRRWEADTKELNRVRAALGFDPMD